MPAGAGAAGDQAGTQESSPEFSRNKPEPVRVDSRREGSQLVKVGFATAAITLSRVALNYTATLAFGGIDPSLFVVYLVHRLTREKGV